MKAPSQSPPSTYATIGKTKPSAVRLLLMLLMAAPLIAVPVGHASTDLCTVRYNDEMQRVTPSGTTIIAVPEFRLSCRGGIHATLGVGKTPISNTQLQLEKRVDDAWVVVERSNTLSYQAEPGSYRLVVAETGKTGGIFAWTLRYSRPLP